MPKTPKNSQLKQITQTNQLGVSFSPRECLVYGYSWPEVLSALLKELQIKRFRLMAYWDLYEPKQGQINLKELKNILKMLEQNGAKATVCLGYKQPRWPETHLPDWAKELPELERQKAYLEYQAKVLRQLKSFANIQSWQLENEFWNHFGQTINYSRTRLVAEFDQIRQLSDKPIIMSLGDTYGLPLGQPKPDLFASSVYRKQFWKGRYFSSPFPTFYYRVRRWLVRLFGRRDMVIHELQTEPWGPRSNRDLSDQEQAITMNPKQLKANLDFARRTGIKYIDLWGAEWWYWRKVRWQDDQLWQTLKDIYGGKSSK